MEYRRCMIVSGRGGSGKSTFAVGLSIALARAGVRVCLADLDTDEPSLDMYLGLEDRAVYHIGDLTDPARPVSEAAIVHPAYPNLTFLPGVAQKTLTASEIHALLKRVERELTPDVLLVDTCARTAHAVAGETEMAYLVLTDSPLALRSATSLADTLREGGLTDMRLVVNRLTAPTDLRDLIDRTGVPLGAIVLEDHELDGYQREADLSNLEKNTYVGVACVNLVARMRGEYAPLLSRMGLNRKKWLG